MTNYANRGKFLEKMIDISNRQYLERGLALISKIPTPTTINTQKKKAFYSAKSIVDFTGVSQGRFIAFDAKETKTDTFKFSRLQEHQEKYLKDAKRQGGSAFILILFVQHNELYRLNISEYLDLKANIGRKSIPYSWFEQHKDPITSSNGVLYDYLCIARYQKGGQ